TGHSLYYMNPDSPDLYTYNDDGVLTYEQTQWDNTLNQAKETGHYFEDEYGNMLTDRTQYAYRKCLGTSIPTVYGSFGTNLSWKGINIGLLFTYSLGGKSWNSNYMSLMSFGTSSAGALHKDILKSWTEMPAGLTAREPLEDGTYMINTSEISKTAIPVADTQLSQYNNASSSRFLIGNDYLTLKNLNVSYDFPKKWVNSLKMQGLNLGFSVDNLFIAARMKGFNPQYSFSGGQGAYYVPSRVYSFQLSVKF
ncbi:MAG: SusC/RagA family TonB-linked outer membrane protein, partial [Muribaculaceae bacterium]|nr:SusC/RagA family TonB-linked outer membrane protein [Muribaculaceae bacterium]